MPRYIYLPDTDRFSVDDEAADRKDGESGVVVRWLFSGESNKANGSKEFNNPPARTGQCALSNIPRAYRTVVVVPLARIAFIDATLPKVSSQKREQLLNFAIEDKLTIDPATVHAVVLGESASGPQQYVVAAIDRAWLSAALAWLGDAGINPQLAVPETALHSITNGEWLVVLNDRDSYAVRPDGLAYAIDYDAEDLSAPPFALTLALNEAAASAGSRALPARLQIRAAAALVNAIDQSRWTAALSAGSAAGLTLNFLNIEPLADMMLPDAAERQLLASNLLTGIFQPASEVTAGLKQFKLAARLACAILALHVSLLSVDAWRTARERQTLDTELRTIFLTSFPQATAVVNAPLQMTRNLRQLENERGIAVEPVLTQLALAAAITREVSPQIASVAAKDGVLTLSLANLSADALATLRNSALKAEGANILQSSGNVSLVIRPAGAP
ncbi:MAG: hypothetical protein H7232_06365 [Aeromicrobium sp.]|nr:hypothetical protein [Burkholderiales bacterium]